MQEFLNIHLYIPKYTCKKNIHAYIRLNIHAREYTSSILTCIHLYIILKQFKEKSDSANLNGCVLWNDESFLLENALADHLLRYHYEIDANKFLISTTYNQQ